MFGGRVISASTVVDITAKDRSQIIAAVAKLQEKIGPQGYVVCTKCGSGIHGDKTRTDPSYIANWCTGECDTLGLDKPVKINIPQLENVKFGA